MTYRRDGTWRNAKIFSGITAERSLSGMSMVPNKRPQCSWSSLRGANGSSALIWFSVGGEHYFTKPVSYEYVPDDILQDSRNVSIPIKNQVGQFVKIQLFFDDIWILVSEISFESVETKAVLEKEDPSKFQTSPAVKRSPSTPASIPKMPTDSSTQDTFAQGNEIEFRRFTIFSSFI